MIQIFHYLKPSGDNLIDQWIDSLADPAAKARVESRLQRLVNGSFGDHRSVGSGVWELRIHYGPGYRVYYAMMNQICVLLLCGGDKRKQTSDIARAIEYWDDFQKRTEP